MVMLLWFVATGVFATVVQRFPPGRLQSAFYSAAPLGGAVTALSVSVALRWLLPNAQLL